MIDTAHNLLPDIWDSHAWLTPDKPAIFCEDRMITWGEFGRQTSLLARTLQGKGIGKGDVVAILMGNSIEHLVAVIGVLRAGACVTSISSMLAHDQILEQIRDSGAIALFADQDQGWVSEAASTAQLPFPQDAIHTMDLSDPSEGDEPGLIGLDKSITSDDLFGITYSSGTTGRPKGIVYTHRAAQYRALTYAIAMRFSPLSRALVTTPIYSNGTWIMTLPALLLGGEVHILKKFSVDAFLDTVEKRKITHTFLVPTQFVRILDSERLARTDLSSVQGYVSSGSGLWPSLKERIAEKLGHTLFELYGFSEGGVTIMSPDERLLKPDSVGRPSPGFDIRILDDAGNELPRNSSGEVAFHAGWSMKGYHNNDEATQKAVWTDPAGRTFLRTGDIGRLDDEGYLQIVDRKKDMIISGGFNIFPSDIEAEINRHPDVVEAAVVGVSHDVWGETPVAFVRLRQEADAPASEILSAVNLRLAKTQRLSSIFVEDEFPRNALGKVVKSMLRQKYLEMVGGEAR